MLDKLEAIKARFDQLGVALTNPGIVNDNKKFASTSKEYRSLEKIVDAYKEYTKVLDDIEFNKEALHGDDDELRELAKQEAPDLEERQKNIEAHIRQLLIPKDPQDEKNAIVEIRAGTGGDEVDCRKDEATPRTSRRPDGRFPRKDDRAAGRIAAEVEADPHAGAAAEADGADEARRPSATPRARQSPTSSPWCRASAGRRPRSRPSSARCSCITTWHSRSRSCRVR